MPRDPLPSAPTSESDLDVTILMPCLNEVRTLPQCIEWASEALQTLSDEHGMHGEIVVSDNGSTDGSVELAERLGARVVHCAVPGYGAALRAGSLAARGHYVIMGDADASYDFRDALPMIAKLMLGYDFCMGSRFKGTIWPGAMPWKNQHIGNPLLTGVLNLLFRSGFSDAHCGMRAFTKQAFLKINPTSTGMEYASEMVIKAALLGCKRDEVPIALRPDGRDRPPHLRPFRDGWRHLRYLIMLSPAWLYLLPGLALIAMGLAIFVPLLATPAGEVVPLGPLWFGDHWMVLAMGMTVCGHLSVLFAMAATLVGIRNGYRRLTPALSILYRCSRLETLLVVATLFMLAGAGIIGNVVLGWAGGQFGELSMQRQMLAGTTALVLGAQSFFGGFLLSVLAGNESDLEKAVRDASQPLLQSMPLEVLVCSADAK
jgi:glycosyl transferase family 2